MLAQLLPSQWYNSDPGSHSGLPSLIPITVHTLIFIAIRVQHFLPPTIRVESYVPTMRGDFSCWLIPLFSLISANIYSQHSLQRVIIYLKDQPY